MPCGGHRGYIVEHMAFRLLHRSEIRNHLFRLHDHFSQKQHAGTDDLADNTHHTHDRMYLLQVTAGRIQLFPDIRHRVDADDIDPPVGQIKEIIHHIIKHSGIPVI